MAELQLPARLRQNEHLRNALKKGGLRGTTAWLIKRLLPVEIYDFFITGTGDLHAARPAPDRRMLAFRTMADCSACDEALLAELGRQSGPGVRSIIASGGRVYALVEDGEILAQLTMDLKAPVSVLTPIPLKVSLPERAGFLSHLYTYPNWRGKGLAQRLIRSAAHDLSRDGISRMVAHVSATNVNSQNAFLGTGWRRSGLMVTDRASRVLYSGRGLAAAGIALSTPQRTRSI